MGIYVLISPVVSRRFLLVWKIITLCPTIVVQICMYACVYVCTYLPESASGGNAYHPASRVLCGRTHTVYMISENSFPMSFLLLLLLLSRLWSVVYSSQHDGFQVLQRHGETA